METRYVLTRLVNNIQHELCSHFGTQAGALAAFRKVVPLDDNGYYKEGAATYILAELV